MKKFFTFLLLINFLIISIYPQQAFAGAVFVNNSGSVTILPAEASARFQAELNKIQGFEAQNAKLIFSKDKGIEGYASPVNVDKIYNAQNSPFLGTTTGSLKIAGSLFARDGKIAFLGGNLEPITLNIFHIENAIEATLNSFVGTNYIGSVEINNNQILAHIISDPNPLLNNTNGPAVSVDSDPFGGGVVPNCNITGDTVTENGVLVYKTPCNFNMLMVLVNNVIKFLLVYFATPLAAIVFAYAGFLLIFSSGNEQKKTQAKSIIGKVLIGYVIALAAWLIINTILSAFGFDATWSFLGKSNSTSSPIVTNSSYNNTDPVTDPSDTTQDPVLALAVESSVPIPNRPPEACQKTLDSFDNFPTLSFLFIDRAYALDSQADLEKSYWSSHNIQKQENYLKNWIRNRPVVTGADPVIFENMRKKKLELLNKTYIKFIDFDELDDDIESGVVKVVDKYSAQSTPNIITRWSYDDIKRGDAVAFAQGFPDASRELVFDTAWKCDATYAITPLHELTHATQSFNSDELFLKSELMLLDNYISDPHKKDWGDYKFEIPARLMVMRFFYGFTPQEKITPNLAVKIRRSINLYEDTVYSKEPYNREDLPYSDSSLEKVVIRGNIGQLVQSLGGTIRYYATTSDQSDYEVPFQVWEERPKPKTGYLFGFINFDDVALKQLLNETW